MIRIRNQIQIRIQEAKKHINPGDPDPDLDPDSQQCFYLSMVILKNFLVVLIQQKLQSTVGPEALKSWNLKIRRLKDIGSGRFEDQRLQQQQQKIHYNTVNRLKNRRTRRGDNKGPKRPDAKDYWSRRAEDFDESTVNLT